MEDSKTATQIRARTRRNTVSRAKTARNSLHRDWMSMLLPIFITVGVSVVANVGIGIYQAAAFKAQVNQMGEKLIDLGTTQNAQAESIRTLYARLPIDYVPRVEQERNRELTKEMRDNEQKRLDAMDGKIDIIIENQHLQPSRR